MQAAQKDGTNMNITIPSHANGIFPEKVNMISCSCSCNHNKYAQYLPFMGKSWLKFDLH